MEQDDNIIYINFVDQSLHHSLMHKNFKIIMYFHPYTYKCKYWCVFFTSAVVSIYQKVTTITRAGISTNSIVTILFTQSRCGTLINIFKNNCHGTFIIYTYGDLKFITYAISIISHILATATTRALERTYCVCTNICTWSWVIIAFIDICNNYSQYFFAMYLS